MFLLCDWLMTSRGDILPIAQSQLREDPVLLQIWMRTNYQTRMRINGQIGFGFWLKHGQMCAKPLSVEKYQHITQGKVNLKTSHVTKVVVLEAPFAVSIKARICSPFLSQLSINGTRTELRHRGWLTFPGYWDSTRAGIGYFHTHFCCTIVLKIFYKSRWNGCHLMIWLPDAVPLCDSTHSCCNIPLC